MTRWARCGALLFTCWLARPAGADQDDRLVWDRDFARVGTFEYVTTGALLGALVFVQWVVDPATEPLFVKELLFDRVTRQRLRASSEARRDAAASASDLLNHGLLAHLFLVDNLGVVAVGDGNSDVAWQMFVINAQSFSLTLTATAVTKRLTARQRPYVTECVKDPTYSRLCASKDRYRSFYSGHASQSATSAGLLCAHHVHLPLYGSRLWDYTACGTAAAISALTGVLRLTSDRHYATDVAVGYLVGALAGFALPTIFYYGSNRAPEREAATMSTPLTATYGFSF